MAEGREVVTALSNQQVAGLARAVARRSRGQVSVPQVGIDRSEAIALWQDVVAAFGPSAGRMLTPRELGALRRRAWRQSAGHAALSEETLSLTSALAFWQLALRLGALAERRQAPMLARAASVAVIGLAATQLAACTSLFGGNIKGSFACSAPGGTCAPSTVIDDQALSVIQNARPMTPAGPYIRQPVAARATTAAYMPEGAGRIAEAGNGMVHRERRVLKVVFPSFVDGGGNLHEPRIVHAVVDDGAWMQLSSGEPNLGEQVQARAVSLASAAYAASPAVAARAPEAAAISMSLPTQVAPANLTPGQVIAAPPVPAPPLAATSGPPSPDAVTAARAKGAALKAGNAIDAIRAEVQARLAQTAKAPGGAAPAAPAPAPASAGAAASPVPAHASAAPANAPTAFPAKVEE